MMKYLLFLLLLGCASGNAEKTQTLYVGDHLVDCTGVAEQKCMLVRENPEDDWSYFYDSIEGFEYEEGYDYAIRVEVLTVDNPPADGSSLKYVFKEMISKVPVVADQQDVAGLLGSWKVTQIEGIEEMKIFPTFEFSEEENRVFGFAGCNNYFATYELNGDEIKIGAAGATRKMCPDMTVEDQFLKHLDKIASYKVINGELQLFDAQDNLLYLAISE